MERTFYVHLTSEVDVTHLTLMMWSCHTEVLTATHTQRTKWAHTHTHIPHTHSHTDLVSEDEVKGFFAESLIMKRFQPHPHPGSPRNVFGFPWLLSVHCLTIYGKWKHERLFEEQTSARHGCGYVPRGLWMHNQAFLTARSATSAVATTTNLNMLWLQSVFCCCSTQLKFRWSFTCFKIAPYGNLGVKQGFPWILIGVLTFCWILVHRAEVLYQLP